MLVRAVRNGISLSVSLAIRRLGLTLVLSFVLFMVVCLIDVHIGAVLFLVAWPTLFFSWPYLSRKFGFDFPRAPQPRKPRPTEWGRLLISGVLSLAVACGLTVPLGPGAVGLFSVLWLSVYYAWPLLSRRMPFLNFTETRSPQAGDRRPLWLRMVRGTGAWLFGFVLTVLAFGSLAMAPQLFSFGRAHQAHDSIHIGMTVPEVLHTVRDCDVFQASSEFPDDGDPNHLPAMGLGRDQNGIYHTFDSATNQTLNLSESEALDRLHAKLHDGYRWTLHYTYTNASPQHVSFSVMFGPDGRVTEVKPVYGWD
jgi:hypothetical protein